MAFALFAFSAGASFSSSISEAFRLLALLVVLLAVEPTGARTAFGLGAGFAFVAAFLLVMPIGFDIFVAGTGAGSCFRPLRRSFGAAIDRVRAIAGDVMRGREIVDGGMRERGGERMLDKCRREVCL